MKIEQLTGITDTSQSQAAKPGSSNQVTGYAQTGSGQAVNQGPGAATLSISARAEQLGKLSARLASLPDVRQSRVDSLRQSATSGAFNPSGSDIANAIVNDETSGR